MITVQPVNNSHIRILTDQATFEELYEYFSFDIQIWQRSPRTGKMIPKTVSKHLLEKRSQFLPAGLYKHLLAFAKDRNYQIQGADFPAENHTIEDTNNYLSKLQLWANGRYIKAYDHQIDAITKSLRYRRRTLLSSTSSGKSLIAYCISRFLEEKKLKGLIIVPTVNLVNQMVSDFVDYSTKNGWTANQHVHKIFSGKDKYTNKSIVVSTWQSIYDIDDPDWYEQFDYVIGDEAHGFDAKCLGRLMNQLVNARYRIGMTGSLKDGKVHELSVIGHFGPTVQVITNKEAMDKGISAVAKVKSLILKYKEEDRKFVSSLDYTAEIDWLIQNKYRNNFIANLALSLDKNSLILFRFVKKHGQKLYEIIQQRANGRSVYFVHGATDDEDRETIRRIVEKENDAIIIASTGVFSTGVSIRNLHAIIFAAPTKSKVKILQSIGRGLRLDDDKTECDIFDIVDDLQINDFINYALKHFLYRKDLYKREQFDEKVYHVNL
jgi:superfamily II DNA or RNA helicase